MKQNWIDAVKGFVIILVLWGHVDLPPVWHKLIYAFHVPFFFILSGFLYNPPKYREQGFVCFAMKRFKSYIVPFLVISAFFMCINMFFMVPTMTIPDILMSNHLNGFYRPLWFLTCFFVSHLLFYGAFKMKQWGTSICIIGYLVMAILLNDLLRFKSYYVWHIDIAFLGTVCMFIGYQIKDKKLLDKQLSVWEMLILLVMWLVLACANKDINLYSRHISNVFVLLIEATLITYFILYLFRKYDITYSFLITFGNKSLFVFCFNFFMNTLIADVFHISKNQWILFGIADLFCFYVVLQIINLLQKCYLKRKRFFYLVRRWD